MEYILIYIIVGFFAIWIIFMHIHPVFGGKKMKHNSIHFQNGKFTNLKNKIESWTIEWKNFLVLFDFLFGSKKLRIPRKIDTQKFIADELNEHQFVWFGHSTVLFQLNGKKIITDPVFFEASPIKIWGEPFEYSHKPSIDDLPRIDYVLISHDHYDHLDYKAIQKLDEKVWKYYVPLWVKSHFIRWGICENKIHEFDWYFEKNDSDIDFIYTPAQHFSGRGLTNRNSTLWGSWVIKSDKLSVFFSWDSGYFHWFKEVWDKYGPFDIAFMENGAYNDAWPDVHMKPEESVQAAIDLQAQLALPIHWWKFNLSTHAWYEPIERFKNHAEKLSLSFTHPKVWEIFDTKSKKTDIWWK